MVVYVRISAERTQQVTFTSALLHCYYRKDSSHFQIRKSKRSLFETENVGIWLKKHDIVYLYNPAPAMKIHPTPAPFAPPSQKSS